MPCFDRCQLIITWMSDIKEVHDKPRLHVYQPIIWSMAAMLGNSIAVVAVVAFVRTRPRAIPLAMITMRKSTHGFLFLSYMGMGLRLAVLRAAGAPLSSTSAIFHFCPGLNAVTNFTIFLLSLKFNKFCDFSSNSIRFTKIRCLDDFSARYGEIYNFMLIHQ